MNFLNHGSYSVKTIIDSGRKMFHHSVKGISNYVITK